MEKLKDKLYVVQTTNPTVLSRIAIGLVVQDGIASWFSVVGERIFSVGAILGETEEVFAFRDNSNFVYKFFLIDEQTWSVLRRESFDSKSKVQSMDLENATAFLTQNFDPFAGV